MNSTLQYRILELFSGIGGMHTAFNESNVPGQIVAAIDINPVANLVYAHNYPNTKLYNNNIEKFTATKIDDIGADVILMSPPCQPFTRVGKQKDLDDTRTDALVHICQQLPDLQLIEAILLENVKGFETSKARDMFIETLSECEFDYREFLLSPSQLGIPNTRYRYYCLARKHRPFSAGEKGQIIKEFPNTTEECPARCIGEFMDDNVAEEHLLPDSVLEKRLNLLDIIYPDSTNSICFTKAYTRYAEGTGSVLCPLNRTEAEQIFNNSCQMPRIDAIEQLKTLRLRYFSPKEVTRLMCFRLNENMEFSFPATVSVKQMYRLLGNSINVHVVSELIKYLLKE